MTDVPTIGTLMRWIDHYAEDTATLHWYERSDYPAPDRSEKQAYWSKAVERRRDSVRAGIEALLAGGPDLHGRIADVVQQEFEDSLTGHGMVADASYLGERVAHALCGAIPEIRQAVW